MGDGAAAFKATCKGVVVEGESSCSSWPEKIHRPGIILSLSEHRCWPVGPVSCTRCEVPLWRVDDVNLFPLSEARWTLIESGEVVRDPTPRMIDIVCLHVSFHDERRLASAEDEDESVWRSCFSCKSLKKWRRYTF